MEIHYVHGINLDTNDPILRKILEFCSYNDVALKLRQYNTFDFEEDQDCIQRLPAIQVYKREAYVDTLYPDYKPIQFLQNIYDAFQLEELAKESKQQIWEERIRYLRSIFRSSKTDSNPSNPDRK